MWTRTLAAQACHPPSRQPGPPSRLRLHQPQNEHPPYQPVSIPARTCSTSSCSCSVSGLAHIAAMPHHRSSTASTGPRSKSHPVQFQDATRGAPARRSVASRGDVRRRSRRAVALPKNLLIVVLHLVTDSDRSAGFPRFAMPHRALAPAERVWPKLRYWRSCGMLFPPEGDWWLTAGVGCAVVCDRGREWRVAGIRLNFCGW